MLETQTKYVFPLYELSKNFSPCTVPFVEQNYNPFLIKFVKCSAAGGGGLLDAHLSFLQVEQQPC